MIMTGGGVKIPKFNQKSFVHDPLQNMVHMCIHLSTHLRIYAIHIKELSFSWPWPLSTARKYN